MFLTTVQVQIAVHSAHDEAVAKLSAGAKLKFVRAEEDGATKIGVLSHGPEFIGWLPEEDSVFAKLLSGSAYRAEVERVMHGRGGRRFDKVIVAVSMPAGSDSHQ